MAIMLTIASICAVGLFTIYAYGSYQEKKAKKRKIYKGPLFFGIILDPQQFAILRREDFDEAEEAVETLLNQMNIKVKE